MTIGGCISKHLMLLSIVLRHFNQPGYQVYSRLESLLVKAANKLDYEDLKFVSDFYGEDFSKQQLKLQLDILAANIPVITEGYDLAFLLSHNV